MSGDILTVKTVKRVRSVRGSALVHIICICNVPMQAMLSEGFPFFQLNCKQLNIIPCKHLFRLSHNLTIS